ncbi:MAG: succinyl-CoA synthetase subunit alpha [Syntrophorhabdus sp. PtaU1.Bin153]|nr:MAG: succinyl-CoA synthetase subunit alpha [Syntrophorhabdus sp. PtaU1.Bin153]
MDKNANALTERTRAYNALFRPKNIVIVGASDNLSKPGGKVLKNILDHGYNGTLRVVNPGADSISGIPSFKSIDDLPEVPELAIVAIPAPFVIPALEDLATRGTKAVIVLTSGFGEKDEKGKEEEERMRVIADGAHMILIGPNCSGFMTPHYSGKFAGIIPDLKGKSVDIISGSGATVDFIMEQAVYRGLSFCNVLNVGNSAQTGVEDLVALYDENYGEDSAPTLMVYLESLKKPRLFLNHARQLTKKGCSIVGIKSGVTESGARAAASHTGAMATSEVTVEALFRKAGIIRVRSKVEMVDTACVLAAARGSLKGNRVCVISDAGGPGVMLSDELERQGVEVPILKDRTRERLSRVLSPESSVMNPIDCLPTRTASQIREVLKIIEAEEKGSIDLIVVMVGNPGMSENDEVYRVISEAIDASEIPVIPVLSSTTTCADLIKNFTSRGKYYFQDEVPLGAAIGKVTHRPRLREPSPTLQYYDRTAIESVLSGREGALEPGTAKEMLLKAGFRFPRQIEVFSEEELLDSCKNIGYPLAMKVIGPLHKSDVGGVRVGISQQEPALSAWKSLMDIEGATGVLVQEMIAGVEVILGASRADDLGHLVMFGLGGIYTEVFKDVRFALSPLAKEECLEMLRAIRGYPILKGIRGERGVSVDRTADYIERLGRLVTDFPAIREIDINPLKGSGDDLFVVDARIIVG